MERRRGGMGRFAVAAIACALAACGSDVTGDGRDTGITAPPAMLAGNGAGGAGGAMPLPVAGAAAGGQGGTAPASGGTGGSAGAAGMAGAAGNSAAGAGGMGMDGVAPGEIVLTAIAANTTVGLDWSRVQDATGYRIYWSNAPGVTPQSGTAIDVPEASYVHRDVENGTAYHYVVTAMLASGEGPPSPEASATPGGEWALEHLGSGDFDDVVSGDRVPRVAIEDRVQVFLFAEGYLAAELATFHDHGTHSSGENDVDRWVEELFALEPYSLLKEAFVIWYLPRASAAHLGEGDTAFDVTVSSGGVGDVGAVAGPLWSAIDGEGSDAFPFAQTEQPINFVASFLLLDAARGRAGYSGLMTSLRNPNNQNQSIRAGFARGHAHEFTHAFSRVSDEYMETNNSAPRGNEDTSNVVASNVCDELPWAHLLEGRGINETPGLVGAFGVPELGYHSELNCLMNGTHDNGQFWCQSGDEEYTTLTLRPNRLCNFCREITAYRVFERTAVLAGNMAFESWKSMYRMPFYDRFGFVVPEGPIPQVVTCNDGEAGMPVYEECVP